MIVLPNSTPCLAFYDLVANSVQNIQNLKFLADSPHKMWNLEISFPKSILTLHSLASSARLWALQDSESHCIIFQDPRIFCNYFEVFIYGLYITITYDIKGLANLLQHFLFFMTLIPNQMNTKLLYLSTSNALPYTRYENVSVI